MPRVVLDPNVLISGLITPSGVIASIIDELQEGAFELVTCPLLFAELETVLLRGKFRRYVSEDEAGAYVAMLRRDIIPVRTPREFLDWLSR